MLYTTTHPVLIELPDEIYDEVERRSERANMPLKTLASLLVAFGMRNLNPEGMEAIMQQTEERTNEPLNEDQGEDSCSRSGRNFSRVGCGKLSVTRRRGESVVVNGPAEIQIHKITGNRVQVYIHAPPETRIERKDP